MQANILLGASAVIGGPGIDLRFLRLRDRSTDWSLVTGEMKGASSHPPAASASSAQALRVWGNPQAPAPSTGLRGRRRGWQPSLDSRAGYVKPGVTWAWLSVVLA